MYGWQHKNIHYLCMDGNIKIFNKYDKERKT